MNRMLFATNNKNKLREVREILGNDYEVLSLEDIGFEEEIPEPHETILENSIYKANFFYEKMNLPCIAEDSGLEVEALGDKPSAYSARYAGPERDDQKNLEKVLEEMRGVQNRKAKFVSIFTYRSKDFCQSFEGVMRGRITDEPKGERGFGYDPIFISELEQRTNAELMPEEKNRISHRKIALVKLIKSIRG
jgi:XTP/dITP diphosphohydrolase